MTVIHERIITGQWREETAKEPGHYVFENEAYLTRTAICKEYDVSQEDLNKLIYATALFNRYKRFTIYLKADVEEALNPTPQHSIKDWVEELKKKQQPQRFGVTLK